MKKFSLLALAFMLVLSGCGQTTKKVSDEVVIYIARHGKTMLNTTDRVQGWADAPLTPAGVEVTEYLGKGLSDIKFDSVYSSDSGRSIQTANIILENNGQKDLKVNTDWRLREFNFGSYEGDLNHTMWNDIAESEGKTLDEWMKTMTPESFANGVAKLDKERVEPGINWPAEDYETIQARLNEVLNEIAEKAKADGDGNVLIVSHGLSIMALISMLDATVEIPAGGLKNASITKIIYKDGTYTIETINDMSYVETGKTK